MPEPARILCFAGSARAASINKRLARFAAELASGRGAEVDLVDLADYPMPLYDGDLEEAEGLPESARVLKAKFRECHGLLIVSPEYNSSIPPLLKNTLDWVSRKETTDETPLSAYRGKVAALAGTSPGALGGLRALVPLRMMLGNIGVHVIPTQLAVPGGNQAFDEAGRLVDEGRARALERLVDELIRTAVRLATK